MIVIGIVIFIFVASYIYFISGLESIDKKRRDIYNQEKQNETGGKAENAIGSKN